MRKTKFVIKNIETGQYFIGWEPAMSPKGTHIYRKGISNGSWGDSVLVKVPNFSTDEPPKLYNTYGGARKIISEFVGKSFAKNDKLNSTEKVLFGDAKLTKYEILECRLKLVEVKKKNKPVDKGVG